MKNHTLESVKNAIRNGAGGYPIIYIMSDGETLCGGCVKREWRQIVFYTRHPQHSGWEIVGADIYWEGSPLFCAHCNKEIESAYGDPDAETEE